MSETELLDLDIQNYTANDVENLFGLSSSKKYTSQEVEMKEMEIREKLLKSEQVNKKFKRDLIFFLESAKKMLIQEKCPAPPAPTSIPAINRVLDPTPNIPAPYPHTHTQSPQIATSRNQELIPSPQIFASSYVSSGGGKNEYYTGKINPLEKRLRTTNICIDTVFRNNYSSTKSSDFTYKLPKPMNNVVSLQLTSLEMPRVWNEFSSINKNNSMTVYLYNMTGFPDASYTVIIPDGNYDEDTFTCSLNNAFSIIGNGLDFLWCEIQDITYSTIIRAKSHSEKCTGGPYPYDPTTPFYSPDFYFTLDFNIEDRPLYKNLGWMMGFRKKRYTVRRSDQFISLTANQFIPVKYEGVIRSESFFGSTMNCYVFLEIDDFNNNFPTDSIISAVGYKGDYLGKNIIARITVNSGPNTVVNDNASDLIFKLREYYGPVNLEKLKIRLLNRFGDVIDLNQTDFSMTLEVKQLMNC